MTHVTHRPENLSLPTRNQQLYDFMFGKGEVMIVDIHRHLHGRDAEQALRSEYRYAQQALGTPITRLNRRLAEHKQAVKPGRLKGTYVLVNI